MSTSTDGEPRPGRKRRRRPATGRKSSRARRDKTRPRAAKGQSAQPSRSTAMTTWRHPRRLLPVSATVLIIGLTIVGLGPSTVGAGLSLLGAAAFLYAIHRYGRLGPDEGDEPI